EKVAGGGRKGCMGGGAGVKGKVSWGPGLFLVVRRSHGKVDQFRVHRHVRLDGLVNLLGALVELMGSLANNDALVMRLQEMQSPKVFNVLCNDDPASFNRHFEEQFVG